jgi:hypothetical protein
MWELSSNRKSLVLLHSPLDGTANRRQTRLWRLPPTAPGLLPGLGPSHKTKANDSSDPRDKQFSSIPRSRKPCTPFGTYRPQLQRVIEAPYDYFDFKFSSHRYHYLDTAFDVEPLDCVQKKRVRWLVRWRPQSNSPLTLTPPASPLDSSLETCSAISAIKKGFFTATWECYAEPANSTTHTNDTSIMITRSTVRQRSSCNKAANYNDSYR